MISVDYCRLLARYNRWMNERLYATAGERSDAERTRDRGAFFGRKAPGHVGAQALGGLGAVADQHHERGSLAASGSSKRV